MSPGFPSPPIPPMEPVKCEKAFDSEDHIFQVKWDGVRVLAFFNGAEVTLQNRRLHDRTLQYPELQSLRQLVKHPIIIDGEIIALKDGSPSFPTVMRRDRVRNANTASSMVKTIPISYMVFDILYYRNNSTADLPWYKRHEILQDALPSRHPPFHIVDNFAGGIELFTQVQKMKLEGIVAKAKDSRYIPGGKSHYWKKIKNRPLLTCYIGGFTLRGTIVNSLLMGIFEQDRLLYIGRAGSGLKEEEWEKLTLVLSGIRTDTPPFENPPRQTGITWVKPVYRAIVEYSEWTEESHLRSPVIKQIL